MEKCTRLGVLGIALIMGPLVVPANASPSISITTPADGGSVSRGSTPTLSLAGGVTFETPQPVLTKYYLRHGPCSTNANADTRSLAIQWGEGDVESCGYPQTVTPLALANGAGEVFNLDAAALPLTLDASRPITATIRVGTLDASGLGAGRGSVTITARSEKDGLQIMGPSETVSYLHVPGTAYQDLNATLALNYRDKDKTDLSSLSLEVVVSGVNALYGFLRYRGQSYVTVPEYSASFDRRVEIALDDGAFSSAGVTLGAGLASWTASIPTPAVGQHVIRARIVQGGQVTGTSANSITVTP